MKRTNIFRMAVVLALIAAPLAATHAQGLGVLSGNVLDLTGKPYPEVTLTITNSETNKVSETKTDAKGHYSIAGVAGGAYAIDLKAKDKDGKDQILYRTGVKIAPGTSPVFDVNMKELQEQGKLADMEAERKRAEIWHRWRALLEQYDFVLTPTAPVPPSPSPPSPPRPRYPAPGCTPSRTSAGRSGSSARPPADPPQRLSPRASVPPTPRCYAGWRPPTPKTAGYRMNAPSSGPRSRGCAGRSPTSSVNSAKPAPTPATHCQNPGQHHPVTIKPAI